MLAVATDKLGAVVEQGRAALAEIDDTNVTIELINPRADAGSADEARGVREALAAGSRSA
ncbi:MAG TPA: hypothetical protein VH165_03460 [Kofleriaceae bacterium]|nr:hypothetical protein [Kofleriaceae bacterium]